MSDEETPGWVEARLGMLVGRTALELEFQDLLEDLDALAKSANEESLSQINGIISSLQERIREHYATTSAQLRPEMTLG